MEEMYGFLISAIKDDSTTDRRYADFVYAFLLEAVSNMKSNEILFTINRHDKEDCTNIQNSIFEIIINKSNFFVCLIDCVKDDGSVYYEPNVWFELGLAASTEKPMFLIAKENTKIPFDVSNVKLIKISNKLFNAMFNEDKLGKKLPLKEIMKTVKDWVHSETGDEHIASEQFYDELQGMFSLISEPCNRYSPFQALYEYAVLHKSTDFACFSQLLSKISKQDELTPRFIQGEEDAFKELTKAIKFTKKKLYTSRFAIQSIVTTPQIWHTNFVNTLYNVSKNPEVVECDRIICNNSPKKWRDIFFALVEGGTNMKVYIRAESFHTHFELVIIDDEIGFIHFYDKSMIERIKNDEIKKQEKNEQRINSTLLLKGSEVCRKLSGIFIRLHHKDLTRYSHTILGVNDSNDSVEEDNYGKIGVLFLKGEYENSGLGLLQKQKDAWNLLIDTYNNCLNYASERPHQSFTPRDAWIMYKGLKYLGDDLGWAPDIVEPSFECPKNIE